MICSKKWGDSKPADLTPTTPVQRNKRKLLLPSTWRCAEVVRKMDYAAKLFLADLWTAHFQLSIQPLKEECKVHTSKHRHTSNKQNKLFLSRYFYPSF